jgi:hypothetical protein
MSLLGEVQRGALQLEPFSATDVRAAVGIIQRHADLAISLADASIVVGASRHKIQDVLTLDQRHLGVGAFRRRDRVLRQNRVLANPRRRRIQRARPRRRHRRSSIAS